MAVLRNILRLAVYINSTVYAPTPPEKIGGGDHNFYKEKKGAH